MTFVFILWLLALNFLETNIRQHSIYICSLLGMPKYVLSVFDSMVLVAWLLWKERNDRVFNNSTRQAAQLAAWIREEGRQWVLAGYSCLSCLLELLH
jgi:hypothetical protein